jgi:hypothetical protein
VMRPSTHSSMNVIVVQRSVRNDQTRKLSSIFLSITLGVLRRSVAPISMTRGQSVRNIAQILLIIA